MPVMPLECVAADASSREACQLWIQHWRPRKTGPGFPLCVVECRTHQVAFTLYPAGHVPYGRVAMAPVDSAGRSLHASIEDETIENAQGDSDGPQLTWDATVFAAAKDAAQGLPWPRRSSSGSGSWRTQGRWIALGAALLGLISSIGQGPTKTSLLGVSALAQREASAAYAAAHGYRGRGRAVILPLRDFEHAGELTLEWLLVAGFVAGRWGPPRRCDPRSGQVRVLAPRARAP